MMLAATVGIDASIHDSLGLEYPGAAALITAKHASRQGRQNHEYRIA